MKLYLVLSRFSFPYKFVYFVLFFLTIPLPHKILQLLLGIKIKSEELICTKKYKISFSQSDFF